MTNIMDDGKLELPIGNHDVLTSNNDVQRQVFDLQSNINDDAKPIYTFNQSGERNH